MKSATRWQRSLLTSARAIARLTTPTSLWPAIDEDLRLAIAEQERRGSPPWRCAFWGAGQYLMAGARLFAERAIDIVRTRRAGDRMNSPGWRLDLRLAVRSLRARPTTALPVVATVALAVGATTAVYSVVDGVLLKPLPYPESHRLARLWETTAAWNDVSPAEFRADTNRLAPLAPSYYTWLETDLGFEALGAYTDAAFVLHDAGSAIAVRGQEATSGLFDALRMEPIRGRRLEPEDDVEGAPRVVVLSASLWHDYFQASDEAIGQELALDGTPHVVVGVMPAGFSAPTGAQADQSLPGQVPRLWTQLGAEARRGWKSVSVLGRLADGVALENASDRLSAAQDQASAMYPIYRGAWAESLLDSVVGDVKATLWFLLSAVGLVLVVATVNIANLLIASGLRRRQEFAVRAAIGAGSRRIAREILAECSVLAALGGCGGVALAWMAMPVLLRYVPPMLPRQDSIALGSSVVLFAIAITAIAAILMGMLPAWLSSRADPHDALRSAATSVTAGATAKRTRSSLVVAEVALACVLLIGAALLAQSYLRLWSVERGFATSGLVAMWVTPDGETHSTEAETDDFARTLASRLGEIPGVQATAANNLPLSGMHSGTEIYLERPSGELELIERALLTVVIDNYFDVLGIPVVAGRGFGPDDVAEAPAVAVVSSGMAERFWPAGDAVGQRLRVYDDPEASIRIVGIARDVRHEGLAADFTPTVYLSAAQSSRSTYETVMRVQGPLDTAVQAARATIGDLSPATPVRRVLILEEAIAESVAVPRFRSILLLGLSGLGAALALVGIYGVVAHTVAQSTREIGIRMALGAPATHEILRVLRAGLRLGIAGTLLGLFVAWAAADLLAQFLFDVAAKDPTSYLAVAVAVLTISILAAFGPARRAANVEPVRALKSN